MISPPFLAHPQALPDCSHEEPVELHGRAFYPLQVALLAAVYFGAAKLGLTMAFVADQVTAVWPPTGIALAALFFFGYRVWPAITLGAFLANTAANAPLGTAAGIALGNTLEALLGAWMLRRLIQFDPALGRVKDVLGLVLLAAALSTMVSATIGVASLCLGGVKPWPAYAEMWSIWWLGDALAVLVVAPLLLTWGGWRHIISRPERFAEAVVLLLALVVVGLPVFAGPFPFFSHPTLAYVVFPFVIWAALRFGQPIATMATVVASTIAIWGTVRGLGPFHAPTIHESLILLQVFMAVVATTTLVLAAVATERAHAEESLQESYNLLHGVIEGTTDAVYVKDRQGRYLMINAAGAGFLGKTVAEVIGQDDTQLFSSQTARAIMEGDRRIMATGEIQTYEDVGSAAGATRTYLSTKGPYRDARGTILGVIGISRDITERKQAEIAMHAREREFRLAREIQQGLLPKVSPTLAGFAIAGASHPAQETGGDYYDFIPMPDGHQGIALGDASGHGIGAALLIAETRAYLRALALSHTDPGTILRLLNRRLAEDISTDHFVTLFFARLDASARSLVYSSAGHWPGYVLDAEGEVKLVLGSTSLPLGVDPGGDFSNGLALTLNPGDLVFLLSDGIVEAASGAGALFGICRALEVVRVHRHKPPGEIVAALLHHVREWSQSAPADDMTAVVIKVGG
jgi:PAS domain S-box-containing protein